MLHLRVKWKRWGLVCCWRVIAFRNITICCNYCEDLYDEYVDVEQEIPLMSRLLKEHYNSIYFWCRQQLLRLIEDELWFERIIELGIELMFGASHVRARNKYSEMKSISFIRKIEKSVCDSIIKGLCSFNTRVNYMRAF